MKKLALAAVLALGLAGCSSAAMTAFNSNLTTTTTNLVALNNALVQINATIIGNVIAQAKILSPYACGTYNLAAAIVNDSNAAAQVNAVIQKNVAASLATVAVTDICTALGQSPTVTNAPASSVPAVVSSSN